MAILVFRDLGSRLCGISAHLYEPFIGKCPQPIHVVLLRKMPSWYLIVEQMHCGNLLYGGPFPNVLKPNVGRQFLISDKSVPGEFRMAALNHEIWPFINFKAFLGVHQRGVRCVSGTLGGVCRLSNLGRLFLYLNEGLVRIVRIHSSSDKGEQRSSKGKPCCPTGGILYAGLSVGLSFALSFRLLVLCKNWVEPGWLSIALLFATFFSCVYGSYLLI